MADETNIKDFWNDVGVKDEAPAAAEIKTETTEKVAPVVQPDLTKEKELSDDELITLLNKRGVNLKSFEDLKPKPTAEEIAEKAKQRKNEVLAYGLKSNKIQKDDYDAYTKAEGNKIAFLYNDFATELKTSNPEITDDEIQDEWNDYTLSNLENDNFKKQRRQKELNELAELKLKNQYSNIYNLENEYSKHEQAENENYSFKRKVEAALPVYQQDIDGVVASLRTTKQVIEDTQNPANNVEVELTFSDADLKELKDAFLTKEQVISRIKNGYTVEAMKNEADMFLWNKHKSRLISKAAKDYNSTKQDSYQAGRKGIIPHKELVIEGDETPSNVATTFWKDILPTPAPTQTNNIQKN